MQLNDLTGQKFNRLKVISRANNLSGKTAWNCVCDCGNESIVNGRDLKNGHTKSCGCLAIETRTTHGLSKSPEYQVWRAMRSRCLSDNDPRYHDYGGRGITVCDRWNNSFEAFIEDMGMRPSNDLTLERIDNEKGYFPANCRWATWSDQIRNQRVRANNNSGLTGVNQTRAGKWRARIMLVGKDVHLYEGSDLFEACCRRKSAELKYATGA
jgi:hypothetical protein